MIKDYMAYSSAEKRAIFIAGSSRSGNTMMSRILGNHPDVYRFVREFHFFDSRISPNNLFSVISRIQATKIYARLLSTNYYDPVAKTKKKDTIKEAKESIKQIPYLTPDMIYRHFLFYVAEQNGKNIFCEKTPRNISFIKEILEIFPEARIICMVRDPRDVLLSQRNKWKLRSLGYSWISISECLRSWLNYCPMTVAYLWNVSLREYKKFENDTRVMLIKFEDLLDNPEKITEKVCAFIGISYSPNMLQVIHSPSSHDRFNPKAKGIDKTKKERWQKLDTTEIYLCQRICSKYMAIYDYKCANIFPNPLLVAYYLLLLPLKLLLILMANFKKYKPSIRLYLKMFQIKPDVL